MKTLKIVQSSDGKVLISRKSSISNAVLRGILSLVQ